VHFRFSDYAKLTIIGVVIACVGWPLVTRLTSQPRRLFLQAAIAITIVLLAPDAYIWHNGASGEAVFVLVWMHVAIAIITYNALVHLAPVRRARRDATRGPETQERHRSVTGHYGGFASAFANI